MKILSKFVNIATAREIYLRKERERERRAKRAKKSKEMTKKEILRMDRISEKL